MESTQHAARSGRDRLYGGAGNDDVDDEGSADPAWGWVAGEEGNDFLYGGHGQTWLSGGTGDDELSDAGGNGDSLYGEDGNECCMRDSNDNWVTMNGGPGTDVCDTTSGNSCTYSAVWSGYMAGAFQCVW